VCQQGRFDEGAELHGTAEELADPDDVETKAILQCVRARLLAHRGDLVGAERSAQAAVETLGTIEAPDLRGDCLVTLAEVLVAADRPDEAGAVLQDALDLYVLKGNAVSAERTQALAGELVALAEKS